MAKKELKQYLEKRNKALKSQIKFDIAMLITGGLFLLVWLPLGIILLIIGGLGYSKREREIKENNIKLLEMKWNGK